MSGLLNLSRNLGLIFGASALGAVFARATPDVSHAAPQAVEVGLHATFAMAVGLILLAILVKVLVWRDQGAKHSAFKN
ncbi:hypothetical protein PFLmoz3_03833 [Pseudomonas fluorescens]|uniref:Uncharacterized protein n=1 Tax=Pseudomonas fluorescens TaxID=294 RepID=A0A109LFK0_PSEFL|nr:hypothetical protein PFLmoz3_03833 [Pseudomonas fluorescens]